MLQMPRMPRTDNTSCFWSVTAYARNRRRPTDTRVITLLLRKRYALPWMPMIAGMIRASAKWITALHVLIHYELLGSNKYSWLTAITMSYICVNNNHERNIPEVMWNQQNQWLSVPRCTVVPRIAQASKALSPVSTSSAICMALLPTVLAGCRRRSELIGLLARTRTQPLCLPREAIAV